MQEYIKNLNTQFQTNKAREHSYRGDFASFLKRVINDNVVITNEPARVDVGAPDFVILKKNIPLCYIEAKDITKDLNSKEFKEQFTRYINGLDNIIFTNYLDFIFYSNQKKIAQISLGKIENKKIIPFFENFDEFKMLINTFINRPAQTIKSTKTLIKLLANRTLLLKEILTNTLKDEKSTINIQYEAFKRNLIHDIKKDEFADIFAQTITFGMFIARYHDYTLEDFSREEARKLIPSSHPFLKGLFKYISDDDEVDSRIIWIIEELAEVFLRTNLRELIKEEDIIYFYEDFLAEYDPIKRKKRGVYYTPKEIVDFMVTSSDLILKKEFDFDGIADERVKILDPATGTGTFLAQIIKFLKKDKFITNWEQFKNNLIDRLFGFEILMASYAMAHLKLDILLNPKKRLNIYLTNSLEKPNEDYASIFSTYLALESREADRIKKEEDIKLIIGNPPYSAISSNSNEWIDSLIQDYKKEYTGERLKEKKHWLNDDYVKFIRVAEYYIQKNKRGIISFITPHGFIDNPTFRGMRYHLLKTFDKIYILNLHGNSRKKESTPNNKKDENVFDIQQGVAISFFIKTSNSKKLADVYISDVWGSREEKYKFLKEHIIGNIEWKKVEIKKPQFYFINQDFKLKKEYEKNSFKIDELFKEYVTGIVTMGDNFIISKSKDELKNRILDFLNTDYTKEELKEKYSLGKNYAEWILKNKAKIKFDENKIIKIAYRPFDDRYIYFDKLLVWRSREKVMKHFLLGDNIGIITAKSNKSQKSNHFIISKYVSEAKCGESTTQSYIFPLYFYNEKNSLMENKSLNLNEEIIKNFEKKLNLNFEFNSNSKDSFNELYVIAYIYAYLYNVNYRKKFNHFLKIDFPRIPYPNKKTFFQYVNFGKELINLHLKKESFEKRVEFIGDSTNIEKIDKKSIKYIKDKVEVKINKTSKLIIPKVAFDFYIGGYQVVLKFLKENINLDRKNFKELNQIVDILIKTDKIMQKIKELN